MWRKRKRGREGRTESGIQFPQKMYGAGRGLEHEALGLLLSTTKRDWEGVRQGGREEERKGERKEGREGEKREEERD